jgi:hypothetical protein
MMENAKFAFAKNVQSLATQLASLENQLGDVNEVYNARLYGPGADNAFTDDELAVLESMGGRKMTADDIYAFIILCDQFNQFLHNGSPAQRDYAGNLNHLRTDL